MSAEPASGSSGVSRVLSWLSERYAIQSIEALEEDYYGALSEAERQAIEELPDDLYEMQRMNAFEWLIAEGTFTPDDDDDGTEPMRFVDVVLLENESLLDAEEREYLTRLGESPLRLYEIVDVEPGEGLWLEDAVNADGDRDAFFVRERSGSQTLRRGDAIGARVLPGEPPVLSGAVYPFPPESFLAVRRAILTGPGGGRRRKIEPGLVTRTIIQSWLARLVQPFPTLVDAATGDPLLLTTIHYHVRDWDRVAAALKADPLVEPDDEDESGWSFFESEAPAHEPRRILWAVTRRRRGKEDRIEVFARTARRADEAERWLVEHAGDALEKIARELTDPVHVLKHRSPREPPREPSPSPLDAMSPDERTELTRKLHEHFYRNWHNDPIPALGNKTPKQAVRSKSGRRDVVQLLKSYEIQEERLAEAERRPPADYGFLWERLGLSREKELG